MIINKVTGYAFTKPEQVSMMPSHVSESLKFHKISEEYIFIIPNEIKDDHMKSVYKVGFLRKFYKLVFPSLAYSLIYKTINLEWQVFKSERQMERLCKKYSEIFEIKEGI